jgi:hypothetical protein
VSVAGLLERAGMRRAAQAARDLRWRLTYLGYVLHPLRAAALTAAWAREPFGRRAYRVLTEDELRARRRSDTVYVFGSGKSILEIAPAEWERIAEHDVVAFSHFHRQRFLRVDYHLIAEVLDPDGTAASIRENPLYNNTVFVVLRGWLALRSNELVGRRRLPPGAPLFRVRRVARGHVEALPSRSFHNGLVHGVNSAFDAANFAYLMGWTRIVLTGIDLYDKEYFHLAKGAVGPGEAPGTTAASRFPGADEIVPMFGLWRRALEAEGVALEVYNPRSLLAEVLPVASGTGG